MPEVRDTFGNQLSKESDLARFRAIFSSLGIRKLYAKRLATQDNSKNQIYLGGDFSSLNIIPVNGFETFTPASQKDSLKPGKLLIRGAVKFSWVDSSGSIYPAPNTKLILYPQYPEVRLSGFLAGSSVSASEWMDYTKQGRSEGRFLLFGVAPDGTCYATLSVPGSVVSTQLSQTIGASKKLLNEIEIGTSPPGSSRTRLLNELKRIHLASPIAGKRLDGKSGLCVPYKAANGGGYTLEAELGISPNGHAEPDFDGWEVKAYSGQVLTLMTPEPNGGFYQEAGVEAFIRRYGYEDRNGREDRLNFGGIHRVGERCALTKLTMEMVGFTTGSKGIQPDGRICLIDDKENVAAEWAFTKLLDHWKKKHAQAAYVPYEKVTVNGSIGYLYEDEVSLGEGTDFVHLLNGFSHKTVYYDPGIKLVGIASNSPEIKRRSQFRIRSNALDSLYDSWEVVGLNNG